jgi:uncharacterized protein YozE (UPF0346 family)
MRDDLVDPARPPTFHHWLVHQPGWHRNDPVGDLVIDLRWDECWPTDTDDLDVLRAHLEGHWPADGAIEALEIAHGEWRQLLWHLGVNR